MRLDLFWSTIDCTAHNVLVSILLLKKKRVLEQHGSCRSAAKLLHIHTDVRTSPLDTKSRLAYWRRDNETKWTVGGFTSGSEGSTWPGRNVLPDDVTATVLSHPTSSGLILWNAELSNFEESFHGQVETIHSTGSSHTARLVDVCTTTTCYAVLNCQRVILNKL